MLHDERIPNLGSKFKWNKIWPPFWPRNMLDQKRSQMLGEKGGQMLLDFNFEARFEILSSFSISYDPICYDFHILKFWPPIWYSPLYNYLRTHLKVKISEKLFWILVIDVQRHQNTTPVTFIKKVDKWRHAILLIVLYL